MHLIQGDPLEEVSVDDPKSRSDEYHPEDQSTVGEHVVRGSAHNVYTGTYIGRFECRQYVFWSYSFVKLDRQLLLDDVFFFEIAVPRQPRVSMVGLLRLQLCEIGSFECRWCIF